MKKQFLTLCVVAALGGCNGGSDNDTVAPTPAVLSGDFSGVATKANDATGTLIVDDVNVGESLVYPEQFTGTYGTFSINAAGEWVYDLDQNNEEVVALVSADMPSLSEAPFTVRTADGTTQDIVITVAGCEF